MVSESSRIRRSVMTALLTAAVLLAGPLAAQGVLTITPQAGYNLIVDSNVESPPTYAPSAAYIGANVCNTGNAALTNVFAYVGNFNGGVGSTPGVFPIHSSTGDVAHPQITNTGDYFLKLEAGSVGTADGQRYIGTLAAGECRMQYWLFSYPQCVNVGGSQDYPPCTTSITGGVGPEDDVSLNYDVWASTSSAIPNSTVSARRSFTMRNEISAAANKIWPNTTSKVPDEYLSAIQSIIGWGTLGPDGQPLTDSNPVYPGQRVITTQGIWYDLGNVGHGFDNNGDLVPDQNAWLQPVGDPSQFDAGCFRMVNAYGVLIVKLKTGGELLIPFQNRLYFENLPDNTGVVGLVYYQYIATDTGCSAAMTPYQESASGFDNEKFSSDFGLSNGLVSGTFGPNVTFEKSDGNVTTTTGSTLTYTLTTTNNTGVALGAPDLGVPLVFRETIPAGTTYVVGSADDSPNTNLTEVTGTGTFTQGYTDINGQLDTCTIGWSLNAAGSNYVILYSTNNGASWTLTEPVTVPSQVTDIQWMLFTTIDLDGYHDGTNCVAPNGVYDNGVLSTSLPPRVPGPGPTVTQRFQVTVNATAGPVICNTAHLGFGTGSASTAQDCTLVGGNNTLSGTVFRDNGTGTFYGNGTQNAGETGIGAGVLVYLYYDTNGNGELDSGDYLYDPTPLTAGTTATDASGNFSISSLPDGPFLVSIKKYDGPTSDGVNNAATDAAFTTNGWGNTTTDPNLPLTSDQGVLKLTEDATTATLAVNIDLDRSNGTGQNVSGVNFGFAPPLRVTKVVTGNADVDADGDADTAIDEGALFSYSITLENRLPSVGVQGPTGCQYTAWATTGTNGSPSNKEFTNPANAWDGPNQVLSTAEVVGGGLRFINGTGFMLNDQAGNITKVEGLYFGYFSQALSDDNLTLTLYNGFLSTATTFNTALIDSYVGAPASLDPNNAISWDVTSSKPGGGSWTWADDFSLLRFEVNPSKASSADAKTFYLDAIGVRITTDQACEAGESTTLSPVPLRDSYDTGRFTFVSASPSPNSVNTATGVIEWNDVGPILPGSSTTVTVTMRANNVTGTTTPSCNSSAPPVVNSGCNWAEGGFGTSNVQYADGRVANNASSKIAATVQGKGEIHGTVWKDTNIDGWPNNDGEPGLPDVTVTLWACIRSYTTAGLPVLETDTTNKTCSAATSGNLGWRVLATTTTDTSGNYSFIGLNTGSYMVEVGNTDSVPGSGSTSPYGGTQTAEPNDTQAVTAGAATGTNGVCAVNCNNTWGWGASEPNLNALNQITQSPEEVITGVNFGYDVPLAFIYGNIWWDVDADTTQDAFEGNLSGFTVQRYSDPNGDGNIADGTLQATTTTDANGDYRFSSLAAGSYVIVVTPPTLLHQAWVETVESTGGTTSLNNQIPVTVTAGQISGSHNFAYTKTSTASVGDTLFYDFDADGIQDANETGIPNVTVWLYSDVDRDGSIDEGVDEILQTDVTDASGKYLFTSLTSASYIVKVDTTDPDFPANVTPTADPDLAAASIGDLLYIDSNGSGTFNAGEDGIALAVVNLYSDTDGNGTLGGSDALVASTITNVNGNYLFTGLTAGRYFVDVVEASLPSSVLVQTTADPGLITLAASTSATSNLTADFGYSQNTTFTIGNRLWHDVDADGVQDAGEPGIPYVDIVVTNGTGTGCSSGCRVTTNAAGFWIVTGLTNGTFTVDVDTADVDFPRFFTITSGTDPRTATVAGADLTNVDFGYRYTGSGSSPTGTISGRVFQDADNDLAYDVGEARASKTVNLLDENGNIVATTTTAADGTYSFTGIFIGNYNVQAIDQLGTKYSSIFLSAAQAFPNLNVIYNATTETVPDSQSSVSVEGVYADLLQDFGYQRFQGSIGDTVYWDINGNGTQDLGEPGFAGVTVRLYDAVWTDSNNNGFFESGEATEVLVATTTTLTENPLTVGIEEGKYLFSNLEEPITGHYYLVKVDTTTIAVGSTKTLTEDPDTDGTPCNTIPNPDVANDDFPPPTVCDSQKLVVGFASGNNYLGADFGYLVTGTGYASIGDSLWIDTDGDGVRDFGEAGIGEVRVWLDTDNDGVVDWTDGNANGVWDSGEGERWTDSDPDGFYAFGGLIDGTYNVRVLTSDSDWPSGLSTTPTYEVRSGTSLASRDNLAQVVVASGVVTSIVDGDGATTDTCSSRTLTATTTMNSTVVTSASFVTADVGSVISGIGIPAGAKIISVVNGVSATISGLATVSGSATMTVATCTGMSVDFGYRYAGTNSVSGTICSERTRAFSVNGTNASTTLTSAGLFLSTDVGSRIYGVGIPVNATITAFTDANTVTISAASTSTGARQLTIVESNGYCGATATTYSGVGPGESALQGITVTAYRWTDTDADNTAWNNTTGVLDSGDTFTLLGSTSTDSNGDYSFANLPDNVVFVFSVSDTQNLRLTTTNTTSSVEDANVLKRQLYEGTTSYLGNLVTIVGRQALNLAGDTDDVIQDLDWAFDPSVGGAVAYDFGDLPASYGNTLLSNSGAQHLYNGSSLYLGSGITTESDGTQDSLAAFDGNDDGITMDPTFAKGGNTATVTAVASAAGWIAGWIDYNRDGDFDDAGEEVLDQAVSAGTNNLTISVPVGSSTTYRTFFARFRIYPSRPSVLASTGAAFSSTFQVIGGEVEDYAFTASPPTLVEMMTMDGVQTKNDVTLTWNTATEVDNLGFHVYRQTSGGERERINKSLIPGSAFITGRNARNPNSYRFVDRKPLSGFVQYWIEDVDMDGTRTTHGPITPRLLTSTTSSGTTTDPDPTLGSVGGTFTTEPGMGVTIPAPPPATQAQIDEQWKLAAVQAAKVIVTKPGWYRVRKSDLIAAGFDPGNNAKTISVFTDGVEVPVFINAKNESKFEASDSIEFFGRGIDTTSTGGRVYYVTAKKGSASRVKSTGARGDSGSPAPPTFPYTFERIERTVYVAAFVTRGDRENFFGEVIGTWSATDQMTVTNHDPAGTAQLELVIQGATDIEHVINVEVNGTSVGIIRFNNQERHVETLQVPGSILTAGENNVTFTAVNSDDDISVLESLRLTYPHTFRADENALAFTVGAGVAVKVNGFTSDQIRVVDITDPLEAVFINGTVSTASDGSRQVSFATSGTGTRTIFAFAESRVLAPAQVAYNEPSTWNTTTNGASLVIITNKAFVTAANSLKAARQAQGIPTVVVDVQNVYDEFSFGHHSPQAIRSFLERTQSWKTKPRYVVLLGDATFDPRNYLGVGSYDFVPTKLITTALLKTSSDDWFADFTNSGVPLLAIGRIPARTADEASAMVNKLTSRSIAAGDTWAKNVDIITDHPNSYPFDLAGNSVAARVPNPYVVNRISIATTPDPGAAITNAFTRGSGLMNYVGHGSIELWSNGHFSSGAASTLTNGNRLPLVVAMNCMNGYFHDLYSDSLAEALLRNPAGGAFGVWASSALTSTDAQLQVNLVFNHHLFNSSTIGDALLKAKQATTDTDVRRSWIFFGDPSMKLK